MTPLDRAGYAFSATEQRPRPCVSGEPSRTRPRRLLRAGERDLERSEVLEIDVAVGRLVWCHRLLLGALGCDVAKSRLDQCEIGTRDATTQIVVPLRFVQIASRKRLTEMRFYQCRVTACDGAAEVVVALYGNDVE